MLLVSQADLKKLNEAQLREQVLVPLFRAMRFQGVHHYHGGDQERGKDIVMWLPQPVGDRLNYAVVAKAKKISGRASRSNRRSESAAEVAFQVSQCFGEPFQDPITADPVFVDRVFVVSSHEINKQAIAAIMAGVSPHVQRFVSFLGGDELWTRVQRHLPLVSTMGRLEEIRQEFENASEHHRIEMALRDGIVLLSAKPKHARAHEAEPLNFRLKLDLPDTPRGRESREAITRHVRTGAPVIIPGDFITNLEIPELFRSLVPEQLQEIQLGAQTVPRRIPASLLMTPTTGDATRFDGLEFRVEQIGTEEATLTNRHQATGIQFAFTLNWTKRRVTFTYTVVGGDQPVKRVLEAILFRNALAAGGRLSFENTDLGLRLFSLNVEPGPIDPTEPEALELAVALQFIQDKTGIPVFYPGRDISGEEVEGVFTTVEHLRSGKTEGAAYQIEANIFREYAAQMANDPDSFFQGDFRLMTTDGSWSVLGVRIPTGPVLTKARGLKIDDAALPRLREALRDESLTELPVALVPAAETAEVVSYFLDWLPKDEAAVLLAEFEKDKRVVSPE